MRYFEEIAAKIAASKASRAVTGWGAWFASSWLFDDMLYPAVIAWLGPIVGGGIMASIAIMICWIWIKKIVASEEEWFSMDVLHKIQKIVFWAVRNANRIPFFKKSWVDAVEFALTFIAINFAFDPMIATLYFHHGNKAKTLSKQDKKIFVWSAIISNMYWIIRSWGLVMAIKFVWKFVRTSL
jgi:hypothetical protein